MFKIIHHHLEVDADFLDMLCTPLFNETEQFRDKEITFCVLSFGYINL